MNQGMSQTGAGMDTSTVPDSGEYETPVPDTSQYETPGHTPQNGRWNVCIILVLLCLYYPGITMFVLSWYYYACIILVLLCLYYPGITMYLLSWYYYVCIAIFTVFPTLMLSNIIVLYHNLFSANFQVEETYLQFRPNSEYAEIPPRF